jgi:TRAP-type C4-dicarboxylate transport system substrate-binding protein
MKRIFFLILAIVSINIAYAQAQQQPAAGLKKMADDKKFKFTATTVTFSPTVERAGASISSAGTPDNHFTLSGAYYTQLTPDSLVSYLPYYGKSKTVSDGGTGSVTTFEDDPHKNAVAAYDYEVKEKKNGSVVINIKPRGSSQVTKYNFDLSPDGTAKLEATIGNMIIKYDGTYIAL